ncbi:MAG: rhomboid family intramembrane serine protease [Deltaproteobacteria bacterium]|nr:rhomboid family intramembrane serine protease [Deltaproteobacteria bacterium]MBW2360613.1 rhomboid family intramembrane serine protease [Deltaproteobacteria bacterium]
MAEPSPPAVVRVAAHRALAQEWALALAADGLASRVTSATEGFAVEVAVEQLAQAAVALDAYDHENPAGERPDRGPTTPPFSPAGFVVGGLLLAFFLVTGPRDSNAHWFARGSADAEHILFGELWRSVTALTLHADLGHVLSNAVSSTLFIGAVCGALGVGLGGALVLLAGAAGNLANALFHGAHHDSVGASTAVFAAVGILSALAFAARRRRETRTRRAWLALGAGLALLAMLGTAGDRVDLWAHLFGWLAGIAAGLPVASATARPPGALPQCALCVAVVAALAACWARALY